MQKQSGGHHNLFSQNASIAEYLKHQRRMLGTNLLDISDRQRCYSNRVVRRFWGTRISLSKARILPEPHNPTPIAHTDLTFHGNWESSQLHLVGTQHQRIEHQWRYLFGYQRCNSDRFGEFLSASSQSRLLLIACAFENSDDFFANLSPICTPLPSTTKSRPPWRSDYSPRISPIITKTGAIKPENHPCSNSIVADLACRSLLFIAGLARSRLVAAYCTSQWERKDYVNFFFHIIRLHDTQKISIDVDR